MLLTHAHFAQLALIPLLVTVGPVVAGLVWIGRRAAWFRGLSASRQLLIVLGLTAWLFVVGISFLNYRQWLDVANVWLVRDGPQGIVKSEWVLIGSADVRLGNGKTVALRADADHYLWLINDSTHTLRRESAFYGPCPQPSPWTAMAGLQALEPPLDIPPGAVLDNPWSGDFGNGPPPAQITVTAPNRITDPFGRCERRYWYAPASAAPPEAPSGRTR